MVVGVTADGLCNPHLVVEAAVEGGAHIVQRLGLQHEVVDPLGDVVTERQRVVARVYVHEGDGHLEAVDLGGDPVAQLAAEEADVEGLGDGEVGGADDAVAEPLIFGRKAGPHERRDEGRLGHRGAAVEFEPVARRVDKVDHVVHGAERPLVRRGGMDGDAVVGQLAGQAIYLVARCELQANEAKVVGFAQQHMEAVGVGVVAGGEAAIAVAGRDANSEHVGGERLPSGKVTDFEAQVAELLDGRHGGLRRRVRD